MRAGGCHTLFSRANGVLQTRAAECFIVAPLGWAEIVSYVEAPSVELDCHVACVGRGEGAANGTMIVTFTLNFLSTNWNVSSSLMVLRTAQDFCDVCMIVQVASAPVFVPRS